jgi:hypothetical protein
LLLSLLASTAIRPQPLMAPSDQQSRSALSTRQHTRKPYQRPESTAAATETRSRGSTGSRRQQQQLQQEPVAADDAHAKSQAGGLLSRFLAAPLGWIGLGSSGSKQQQQQQRQQPPASRSARQQQPSAHGEEDDVESASYDQQPPLVARTQPSTAERRYTPAVAASSGGGYYNDPPASTFLSSNRFGSTSSTRPPPPSSANGLPSRLHLPQRASPAPTASLMRRSETTLGFPSSSSSGSAAARAASPANGAWQERYARRVDHGGSSNLAIERAPVLVRPPAPFTFSPFLPCPPADTLTRAHTRLAPHRATASGRSLGPTPSRPSRPRGRHVLSRSNPPTRRGPSASAHAPFPLGPRRRPLLRAALAGRARMSSVQGARWSGLRLRGSLARRRPRPVSCRPSRPNSRRQSRPTRPSASSSRSSRCGRPSRPYRHSWRPLLASAGRARWARFTSPPLPPLPPTAAGSS